MTIILTNYSWIQMILLLIQRLYQSTSLDTNLLLLNSSLLYLKTIALDYPSISLKKYVILQSYNHPTFILCYLEDNLNCCTYIKEIFQNTSASYFSDIILLVLVLSKLIDSQSILFLKSIKLFLKHSYPMYLT